MEDPLCGGKFPVQKRSACPRIDIVFAVGMTRWKFAVMFEKRPNDGRTPGCSLTGRAHGRRGETANDRSVSHRPGRAAQNRLGLGKAFIFAMMRAGLPAVAIAASA